MILPNGTKKGYDYSALRRLSQKNGGRCWKGEIKIMSVPVNIMTGIKFIKGGNSK